MYNSHLMSQTVEESIHCSVLDLGTSLSSSTLSANQVCALQREGTGKGRLKHSASRKPTIALSQR